MKRIIILITAIIILLFSCGIPPVDNVSSSPVSNTFPEISTILSDDKTSDNIEQNFNNFIDENEITSKIEDGENYTRCNHGIFNEYFHAFDGDLCLYIGMKTYHAWVENARKEVELYATEKCELMNLTLPRLLKDFNISKEEFELLTKTTKLGYIHEYNADILYSGNETLIEEYYTTGHERLIDINRKFNEYNYKNQLMQYVAANNDIKKWESEKNDSKANSYLKDLKNNAQSIIKNDRTTSIDELLKFDSSARKYSIPEIIYYFSVPRIEAERRVYSDNYYDFDYIYGEGKETLAKMVNAGVDPMIIDNFINKEGKKDEVKMLEIVEDVIKKRAKFETAAK